MDYNERVLTVAVVLAMVLGIWFMSSSNEDMDKIDVSFRDVKVPESMSNHSQEFAKPEIVKVTDGVYVAIGYALANVVLLEGQSGVVIVDVTESNEAAAEIYRDFRNITKKPVKGIVYTHSHADHVLGTKAFLDPSGEVPEIWAHHSFMQQYRKSMDIAGEIIYRRASRQFGIFLNEDLINSGIGPRLRVGTDSLPGFVPPNRFLYKERKEVTIAGLTMELIHIPGETSNQIGIWLASKRVLLCADDLYKAFPNLYAIRGTPTRDLLQWVLSLDKMRRLSPHFLVPSHTRPIIGENKIAEIFLVYRDAIQLVHDQTVRFMNKGFTPDEIVEKISLPESLSLHPYLQQFYGTLSWSVRGVFNSYLGWFSGDPKDLSPLSPKVRSEKLISLAGGTDNILTTVSQALKDADWQWALELVSSVLTVEPNNKLARTFKLEALKLAAASQTSLCGRNYYLTSALEEARQVNLKPSREKINHVIQGSTLDDIFLRMGLRFKAEECSDIKTEVLFSFTDVNVQVCINVKNGVVDITKEGCAEPKISVTTTRTIWIQLLTKELSAFRVYSSGQFTVDGGVVAFKRFVSCFDTV